MFIVVAIFSLSLTHIISGPRFTKQLPSWSYSLMVEERTRVINRSGPLAWPEKARHGQHLRMIRWTYVETWDSPQQTALMSPIVPMSPPINIWCSRFSTLTVLMTTAVTLVIRSLWSDDSDHWSLISLWWADITAHALTCSDGPQFRGAVFVLQQGVACVVTL